MNPMQRFLLVASLLFLTAACTANYPVVGSFDEYNEVFIGEVNHNLASGTAFIEVEAKNSGIRCSGDSHVVHVPASNYIAGAFLIPYCTGQKGKAYLSCDDGRFIDSTWTADSCTSGYGYGTDERGARFQFAFGMSEDEAFRRFEAEGQQAEARPEFPVYRPRETRKEIGYSTGTGFLVTDTGHMVTNYHVIEDASNVYVVENGVEKLVTVLRVDADNDVALLKTEVTGQPVNTSQPNLFVAEDVMTLGYPLVQIQGQALKASFGRINSLSGLGDDPRFVQIDVPIQPGNSGGPLINTSGQLVGVVTATLNQLITLRESGALPQNVNYAVKAESLTELLTGLPVYTGRTNEMDFKSLVARYDNSVYLVVAR